MTLEQRFIDFMSPPEDGVNMFLHYRLTQELANECIDQGVKHEGATFSYKTDNVGSEPFDSSTDFTNTIHLHNARIRTQGSYTVVIGIGTDVLLKYRQEFTDILKRYGPDMDDRVVSDHVPSFLSEEPALPGPCRMRHTLPKQYVKGWFCEQTGELVENPDYNPHHDNEEAFMANLAKERQARAEAAAPRSLMAGVGRLARYARASLHF